MTKTLEKLKEYIESGTYKYSSPIIGKEEVECCIEALKEKKNNTWTSVKESLPPKPQIGADGYIVQEKNVREPFSAYWDGERWTDSNYEPIDDVIAWMPLPNSFTEEQESVKEIEIKGCVTIPTNVTHEEFLEKFIKFIGDNGWHFGGGTKAFINGKYIDE